MNLEKIHTRVDQALADNKRAERLITFMALALFVIGISVLIVAYWLKNPYVAGGGALMQGFLVLPINEVRRLRRDNIILQTFPVLIDGMPAAKVAAEITKLLAYLRGGR